MKPVLTYTVLGLCLSAFLLACAPEPQSQSVWDTYDVRHPVPLNTPVYNAYPIDNDAYYAAPDCTVMDSPGCISD